MSPRAGDAERLPALREVPPAPPSYRLPGEPVRHGFHPFMCVRDTSHAAHVEGLGSATVEVLLQYAIRTDADGVTRASLSEVATAMCRSTGTIQKHVKRLVELRFMENIGRCRADNRHRLWRIAGMDRRDKVSSGPGENQHRGDATSRARGARHPSTSRASGARFSVELPGELLEPTRALRQEVDADARWSWGTAKPVHREGLDALRTVLRRQSGPGAPRGPSDDAQEPEGSARAENATEEPDAGAA